MTGDLGPEARALLDAAREGLSPDAAAVRRVRARIHLVTGGATGGAAAGTALGVKLGLAALAVVVAAATGLYVRHTRTAAAVSPELELASTPDVPRQAAMREPADESLITIETPGGVATPGRAGSAGRGGSVGAAGSAPEASRAGLEHLPAATAVPPTPSMPSTAATARDAPPRATPDVGPVRAVGLAREVELVDLAMAALRRGDPGGALRAVQRHTAETLGHGQLAEDAAAIEIEALCHLHDPSTNARLEAFDARFPSSAQRSRLNNQCP